MRTLRRMIISLLVATAITVGATACLNQTVAPTGGTGRADQCSTENGVKLEEGPWVYSGSQVVTCVCIKAGRELIRFNQDGTDGCYTVTGLGTTSVTVTGGGTSRDCKDISNVVFSFSCDGGSG